MFCCSDSSRPLVSWISRCFAAIDICFENCVRWYRHVLGDDWTSLVGIALSVVTALYFVPAARLYPLLSPGGSLLLRIALVALLLSIWTVPPPLADGRVTFMHRLSSLSRVIAIIWLLVNPHAGVGVTLFAFPFVFLQSSAGQQSDDARRTLLLATTVRVIRCLRVYVSLCEKIALHVVLELARFAPFFLFPRACGDCLCCRKRRIKSCAFCCRSPCRAWSRSGRGTSVVGNRSFGRLPLASFCACRIKQASERGVVASFFCLCLLRAQQLFCCAVFTSLTHSLRRYRGGTRSRYAISVRLCGGVCEQPQRRRQQQHHCATAARVRHVSAAGVVACAGERDVVSRADGHVSRDVVFF